MKSRFPSSTLLAAVLAATTIFGGAGLAAAQADSAQIPREQEKIRSTPSDPVFKTLVNFDGTNGADPGLSPIQGTDGNLYGGTGSGGEYGQGVLFKMTPTGALTTIYNFCAESGCPDGNGGAPEVLGTDGNFYGETGFGGAFGDGTLFKFTEEGELTTLSSFDGTDGSVIKHLVQSSSGKFYGTTSGGGNLGECYGGAGGCGTVFEMTPSGMLTTLHDFCSLPDCTDGAVPFDALVQGADGNFYGTTWAGGAANAGTIFQITPTGTLTTLYTFCVSDYPFCGDGSNPIKLVLGSDGNFYGTTANGAGNNEGSVFKITPSGTLTTIYSFCAQIACTDGATPRDGLTLGSDGNFYSTTYYGGAHNQGTIFQITSSGVLTTLHSFNGTGGRYPIQHLFQATNGVFYGITDGDGTSGDGTIFSLSVGLAPFAETVPTSGKVGTKVIILGNKLTGSTSVTFNGTAAVFEVISTTEITAAVPTGVATGAVQVTTPSGTLTSNVNFRVEP
ncbi:MAG: choice-of-anchor tandem repeat GloVer-containing protein [Candidatus Sulfotelmatobacter sp.]